MGEVIGVKKFHEDKQKLELIEKVKKIPERYEGDIKRFVNYCKDTNQNESVGSLLNYLSYSIVLEEIKKTTWERRLAAAKKYLSVTYGINFDYEQKEELAQLRRVFSLEEYKEQTHIKGKSAADKDEVMEMIRRMEDPRSKAISLVNLITANRPNEMVRLKISDFDLNGRFVRVYLKKQKEWINKRLTQETIKAVQEYIKTYGLKSEDYFVGRARRGGHYESTQISEVGYNKLIQRLLGFAPYTLRKTQVSAMHEKGADLPAIAKQTGHKSLEVLSKHYLKVSDSTIDKFL